MAVLLRHQQEEVPQPPEDEGPVRSVPNAGEEPDHQQVEKMPPGTYPIAAQGDVHIIPEPGGQRDVPPAPEIGNGYRQIGLVEVLQEVEAKHPPQADGHIAVAGEIEIDLQSVGYRSQPSHGNRNRCQFVKSCISDDRHAVGQDHFFAKALDKARYSLAEILPGLLPAVDLRGNGLVTDDRSGDELWEKGHVKPHVQDTALGGRFLPIDVDDVAHGLEGIEGDANGQGKPYFGQGQSQCAQVFTYEAQVLEYEQPRQVQHHRRRQEDPPVPSARLHPQPQPPVGSDRGQQQQHIHLLPPSVEKEGYHHQQHIAESFAPEKRVIVKEQRAGQKEKQKLCG